VQVINESSRFRGSLTQIPYSTLDSVPGWEENLIARLQSLLSLNSFKYSIREVFSFSQRANSLTRYASFPLRTRETLPLTSYSQ